MESNLVGYHRSDSQIGWQSRSLVYLGIVRSMSEKLENAALVLCLGLLTTLIHHKNGAFQNCSSNQMTLTMPAFLFCGGSKHIENGALQKQWHHVNHGISWLKHKSKMSSDCCIFKFVQHSVVIWCIFRVKPRFSNFSGTVWTGQGLNCQELWLNKLTPYSVLFLLWKQ